MNALPTSTRHHTRYHTRYRTFFLNLTWIGHNAMRYHNFNVLLHALQRVTSLSLAWFGAICNALAQNQANLRENMR